MKHSFSPAVGVARLIKRSACAVRFRGKMGEGKISTEAIASILALSGEPIFRDTDFTGAQCQDSAIPPPTNLHTQQHYESISTSVESSTAVQHLTKALFLSKPARPLLSSRRFVAGGCIRHSVRPGRTTDGSHRPIPTYLLMMGLGDCATVLAASQSCGFKTEGGH